MNSRYSCTFRRSEDDDKYRAVRDSNNANRCICNKKGVKHGVQCINCHNFFFDEMTDWERKGKCEIHKEENEFLIQSEYVCDDCNK